MAADGEPATARAIRDTWPTFDLRCAVESRENAPDRCVVYPADAAESEIETLWLAAAEDSFLSVEDLR